MAAAAVPGAIPQFALAPALVGAGQPLDYSNRAGQTLYANATAPLPYIFNGKESSLPAFLQAIQDRSAASGWDDIFQINIGNDAAGNPQFRDLLRHYGEITIDTVRAEAALDYIGQQNRNAQVSHQIYQCLKRSISATVTERMVTETNQFMIQDIADGPTFLMVLIQVFFVQTEAQPSLLRIKISQAYLMIAEHEYNVDSFNTEINAYVQKLAANGEATEDLFAHLTKAYKAVPDKYFHQYIVTRIDEHNDRTRRMTAIQFMNIAKSKYDELVDEGTWLEKDNTEKQLVALTAQLEQIELKNKKLQQKLKDNKKSSQSNKSSKKDQTSKNKWKWKDVAPKQGEKKTKEFEGKTYHWCKHHKKWTIHKPEDCRLKDKPSEETTTPTNQETQEDSNTSEGARVGFMSIYDDGTLTDL